MQKSTRTLIIFFLVFIITNQLHAQQVTGMIADNKTGEPLTGSTIILENNSKPKLAATAGLDGGFVLKNVTPGNYKIRVKYIGYNEKDTDIVVETTNKNLSFFIERNNTSTLNEVTAHAQLPKYLGTKTPYHPQQTTYTKTPEGYKPVFINYVGRHGSRFLTSAGSDVFLLDILGKADAQNALTAKGEAILKQLKEFEGIENDNYGNITKLGEEEQYAIAERMQTQYPSAFRQKKILVEMTEKLRTQQSANAFLSGLKNYDSSNIQRVIFPSKTDSILRFYDLSPAYDAYETSSQLQAHLDSLQKDTRTKNTADEVCKKIFTDAFLQQINSAKIVSTVGKKNQAVNKENITQALYDVYAILFSAKEEMSKPFINTLKNIFTDIDLSWLNTINNAEDFYQKGPADNTLGIQVTIASPLLRDLIFSTDSSIKNKNVDAIFRFTHAEAISPLATLMEIPQAYQTSNSVFGFSNKWNASEIIPLSANIQWIIYSNGDDYLVKILLNEKEVKLPLPTSNYPYYNWNDMREYYLQKLQKF